MKTHAVCLGRHNINQFSISIYGFAIILIKTPARFFFVDTYKSILKCLCKGKETRLAKTVLKKGIKWEGSVYLILRGITELWYSRLHGTDRGISGTELRCRPT